MSDTEKDKLNELLMAYKTCTDEKKKKVLYLNIFEKSLVIVKKIANTINPYTDVGYDDLTQIGSVGLMKAIESYKPEHKAKFNTYATYFIKGEIRHYLRDKSSLIRVPRDLQELLLKVSAATKELVEKGINDPSIDEIAEILSLPADRIEEVKNIENIKSSVSLDQYLKADEEDLSLMDKIPAENYQELISKYENKILLKEVINKLPEDLKEIVEMNYFQDLSQREIAEKIHSSQMQVSRKLKKALNQMYQYLMNKE